MSGSITQLNAMGALDNETMVDPQITFFKSTIKRHSPFVMEPKFIEFTGTFDFGKTTRVDLPRSADLYGRIWLVLTLDALDSGRGGARWVEGLGYAMFDEVRLDIGSVTFDRLYPELQYAMEELQVPKEKRLGKLVLKTDSEAQLIEWSKSPIRLYVPLCFYWCSDWGYALPIVALSLTQVSLVFKLKKKSDLIVSTTTTDYKVDGCGCEGGIQSAQILGEGIYLSDAERTWLANNELKYLFTQNQFQGTQVIPQGSTKSDVLVRMNHPIREFVVLFRKSSNTTAKNYFNFEGEETGFFDKEAFKSLTIKFNNNERVPPMEPVYYRICQPNMFHSRIPDKHIYVYSFSLFPEDYNPSGSVNLSRIDSCIFTFNFSSPLSQAYDLFIFGRNFNLSTIKSGVQILMYAS